jgi:hypothetical protein
LASRSKRLFLQEHPQVVEGCLGLLSGQPDHERFGEFEEATAFAPAGIDHPGAVG